MSTGLNSATACLPIFTTEEMYISGDISDPGSSCTEALALTTEALLYTVCVFGSPNEAFRTIKLWLSGIHFTFDSVCIWLVQASCLSEGCILQD
jgi:hypothetical protein